MPHLIGYYSIPAFFICLLLIFAVGSTPLFSWADTPPDASVLPGRLFTLDGLRGFLALAVVFHHITVYRNYEVTGLWSAPTRFYTSIGEIGVDLFFCITGFLFWSRILREKGHHRWLNLYVGRIFRIGPLFLVAFAAVATIAFGAAHFKALVRPLILVRQLSTALTLGIVKIPDINGFANAEQLLDRVEWSLKYEWLFYLSLPVLAKLARNARWRTIGIAVSIPISLILVALKSHEHLAAIGRASFLFLVGMLVASITFNGKTSMLKNSFSSIIVIVTLSCAVIFGNVAPLQLVFTALAFYLIASGSSLFGLFLTRPARRLGDISYGIYLLQGLPHALVFRVAYFRSIALASPTHFWSFALVSTILLCLIALVAHVAIERPGIVLGKYVYRNFSSRVIQPVQTENKAMKQ